MPPLSLPLQSFSLPSFALSPLFSKPSFHPPSIPSSSFSYQNLRIAAAAAADDEDHVIGDCLVFEDGAFEDPAPPGPAPAPPGPAPARGGTSAPSEETLIPDRWKEAVEEMKLTKKEKRKISHGLRFASKLNRRRKSPAPAAEEYEAFRELKLSQLKPVVLDDPKEFGPPAEEEVARRGRVAAVNPRLGMREGGLEDIREFFSSGEYVPGKILDDKKPKGTRKLFTQEEKTLLNKRIPNLGEATSSKWLPLHSLAASGEFYLLDALLKHNVDINAVDKDGLSAMHKAIFCKKQAIINYLLRNSANPHIRDKDGATLIHYAVQTASSQTIKILLLYDVDINLADNDGWTPLHLAVQAKRTDIVRLLLIKGADRTLKNGGGLTPLDLCLYSGHDEEIFMDSLRKSFKSQGSYKYSSSSSDLEERPILAGDADDHREAAVKIDGDSQSPVDPINANNSNNIWRGSSYDFCERGRGFSFPNQALTPQPMAEISEDPPSRLISSFIDKQRASGAEMALDVDLEMHELKKSSNAESREVRVSFVPEFRSNSSDVSEEVSSVHQRDRSSGEVLRCTSNSSFQRGSGLLRVKTRSRLMDPPTISPPASPPANQDDERKSGLLRKKSGILKSGILKSGLLSKFDEDEEDPFLDEDLPEDYKNVKFDAVVILEIVSLVVILGALICSLTIPKLERLTVWSLHLWKWEVMILSLICGRLLSGWIIRVAVFFIERNFLLRKKVLYFVYGVRHAVQNCLWLGLVLLTWHYMFDKKVERETNSSFLRKVTKIIICFLLTTLVWLVKTLLVKVLASSFHVSTYFERIQESLFNQYVIGTLSGPPLVEIQQCREEEDRMFAEVQKLQNAGARIPNDLRNATMRTRSGRFIGGSGHGLAAMRKSTQLGIGKSMKLSGGISKRESGRQEDAITIDQLHKLNQKNVSAWNMKRLMKIVRNGTLTTLDEQLEHEHGGDESSIQIKSEFEAKVAARKIFNNVARPGSKYIYFVDLMRFMREDEARKTMSLFEGADENNRVSRRCLKNWVVNAFKERRALSLTLNDTKTAVNKLHQMANVVVGLIVLAIWLLILDIASTHFFVLLGSQLLVAVFMFGNTLKMVFEDIIFLFVMHPFDVGDRCEIDGVQMFVEEMNILTTIFLRWDNQKITYPNSVLATLPIGNYYRSPDMCDSINFCVHVSTPLEKIAIMKERIIGYIESKKEHWYPNPSVVLKDVDDMNRLKVSIWMQHRINFQDMTLKWERRELIMREMIKVLKELDIEYRMLPVDINVREMPSVQSTRMPSNWRTCS